MSLKRNLLEEVKKESLKWTNKREDNSKVLSFVALRSGAIIY